MSLLLSMIPAPRRLSSHRIVMLGLWCLALLTANPSRAAERLVGDLDRDGLITVTDLARAIAHISGQNPLSESEAVYADVNRDGLVNDLDRDKLVALILGTDSPKTLPATTVLETSPASGETGVALTREFILRLAIPLALDAIVKTNDPNTGEAGNLYAEFGGRRLLTRVEISSDRRKVTLFFLEPVPASARIRVTFDAAGLKDLVGREIDADGDGVAGGVSHYDFDTLGTSSLANIGVVGTVYGVRVGTTSSDKVPLQGVTITVDGAEQTLRTTTAADGTFSLSPAPAGRFFVLIDGRTATSSGTAGYYAFVGKAWEGVPGKMDTPATPATSTNAAGDIYLPFIASDTLKAVSASTETKIEFTPAVLQSNPALQGVQITVPANSLFANDGTRGGKVGIAPVSPDKLPEPLPPGLNFPLVITIQTDGATNFDRPVPVRFPNLPDPVTGKKLLPGEKSALFSFNHDTGHWELQGPMTVSADGNFVDTDLGVGVRQPGWHGPGPFGNVGGNGAPPCLGGITGNNEAALEKFKEAEDILKDKELDLAKSMLVDVGGNALRALDPLLKTKDCINQSLDGAPNFFGSNSLFYMPRGCIDMAVEFLLLPLEELKAAKVVGETALSIVKGAKAVSDFSDFINDAKTMKEKFDEANALLEVEQPCPSPGAGPTSDPRAEVNAALQKFGDASQQFVDATPGADAAFKQLDTTEPDLSAVAPGINPNSSTLGLNHDQQASLATSVIGEADAWYRLIGPGGYLTKARNLIEAWSSYQQSFYGYASSGVMSEASGASSSQLPKRVIYMLEYGTVRQRVMKQNGGGFDFFLPAGVVATLWAYEVDHKWIASAGPFVGPTAGSKAIYNLHFHAQSSKASDADSDGLTDDAEKIVGSDPTKADTNGDGILDGAALQAGMDPTSGKPTLVGIVSNLPTQGTALNVAASGNLIVTAEGTKGIELYDGTDRGNPRRLGQLPLVGSALGLGIESPYLAVSLGAPGVAIVNIADPVNPVLAKVVPLLSPCNAVALSGGIVITGNESGGVASIDAATQAVLSRQALTGNVQDIAVNGNVVYVYVPGSIHVLLLDEDGGLSFLRTVSASGYQGAGTLSKLRLFVALDRLYASSTTGLLVFNIGTDPQSPVLLKSNNPGNQAGFKQLVMATPTLGLFTVGNNSTPDGPHNLQLYNISANGDLGASTASLVTPGIARSVTVVNGLAYVADSDSGLEVMNYLATETGTTPPTVALSASFPLEPYAHVEEGSRQTLTVDARDDVQVRNVELYVNGALFRNDANFPFQITFNAPLRAQLGTHFLLQAKAYDTAGNKTELPPLDVALELDSTPPRLVRTTPAAGGFVGQVSLFTASFNEAIDPATVTAANLLIRFAGPDSTFGTADDSVVSGLSMALSSNGLLVTLTSAATLAPGLYRLEVNTGIKDLVGNSLATQQVRQFTVMGFADRDGDGVPDNVEVALGLDPDNPDTNGNGVPDGVEDFDQDKLSNAWEIAHGYDPTKTDSDANGIKDVDEDPDLDGLTNLQEQAAGSDPFKTDTDGDGWSDATEVDAASDPADPHSMPHLFTVSRPPVAVVVFALTTEPLLPSTTVSRPSVQMVVPALTTEASLFGTTVSSPPVQMVVPALTSEANFFGTTVARPAVQVAIPVLTTEASVFGTTVATPQVEIAVQVLTSEPVSAGTTVAQPPVSVQIPTL